MIIGPVCSTSHLLIFCPWLQELVAAVPSQRNWKGMGISIFVILSVIGLVALAVVVVTPPDPGPRLSGRRIELNDILAGKLKPRYFNGTWISGKIPFFLT